MMLQNCAEMMDAHPMPGCEIMAKVMGAGKKNCLRKKRMLMDA
jgi:hypothetical protein